MDNEKEKSKKKKSLLGRFLSLIGSLTVYISLAIIIASLASVALGGGSTLRIFGYSPYFIETFSMQSVMPAGSVVIANHHPDNTYEIGDDISFYDIGKDGKVVTHRIIDIEEDDQGRFYVTKGVNNDEPDKDTVYEKNVIGKIVMVIPELGIYTSYIKENIFLVVGFVVSGWFVLRMIRNLIFSNEKQTDIENARQEVMPCESDR